MKMFYSLVVSLPETAETMFNQGKFYSIAIRNIVNKIKTISAGDSHPPSYDELFGKLEDHS